MMDKVSIQKRVETKDGCFILKVENDTECLVSNVDEFNDVEAQEPSTSATSLASIKVYCKDFEQKILYS